MTTTQDNFNAADIHYVVFDDERSFPPDDLPGVVHYCRTSQAFLDFVQDNPPIDVLALDFILGGADTTEAAVDEYIARIQIGELDAPGSIFLVTSSGFGATRLIDIIGDTAPVTRDHDGRTLGLGFYG